MREAALRRGITVFVPTPRLRGGFKKPRPCADPEDQIRAAASLSKGARFAEAVALAELPQLDAIVCGSVAVTRDGRRCGKGEGYSDLEYAILCELGHAPVPVATTVHPVQVVGGLPRVATDLPLAAILTPDEVIGSLPRRRRRRGSTGRGSARRIWTRCRCSGSWRGPNVAEHSPDPSARPEVARAPAGALWRAALPRLLTSRGAAGAGANPETTKQEAAREKRAWR